MPALPSSLISSVSSAPAVTVPETAAGLPAALAGLPDPRARRGVRHQLTVVVTAAVCAVVAGYRSYTAIAGGSPMSRPRPRSRWASPRTGARRKR
ncbi:transposase family protein [Micromonospora sp. NPDC047548]|uniref:transposase family protein n=1 Tax=Micromonospora sp. NPDC047548 TaxID=3155624 RepID=UPI0033EEAE62